MKHISHAEHGETPDRKACICAAVLCAVMFQTALAADWPQWRGPDRSGVSTETNWLVQWPPVEAWRITDIGVGYSSPAVSEGRVYATGLFFGEGWWDNGCVSNMLYCLDAENGAQIWKQAYPWDSINGQATYSGPRASPVVSGNELYTFDDAGLLCCFEKMTGTALWSTNLALGRTSYGYASSPLVEGNLVIVNAGNRGIAVNRNAPHEIVWPAGITSISSVCAGYGSALPITVGGKRFVVVAAWTNLFGIDVDNGQIAWSRTGCTLGWHGADPVVYNDKLYVPVSYKGGLLLPATNSVSTVWATGGISTYSATPVILNGYAYGIDDAGALNCFDINTGVNRWKATAFVESFNTQMNPQLIASDGKLIVLSDNKLRVIDASPSGYSDGGRAPVEVCPSSLYPATFCGTVPALANGKIYCRIEKHLVCYRAGSSPGPADDFNRNGVPDAWEYTYFKTNACFADADADGDGMSNLREYMAGTDPMNAASVLKLTAMAPPSPLGSGLVLQWSSASNKFYTIKCSTNLITGFAIQATNHVPATPPVNTCTVRVDQVAGFFLYKILVE